eukprot:2667739-Pyramimonas_sp.AAC.1
MPVAQHAVERSRQPVPPAGRAMHCLLRALLQLAGSLERSCRTYCATENIFNYHPGRFTFIWASPPCTEYSRATTGPRSRDLEGADELVSSALACIHYLKPRYWCIENPDGLLRTRPLMRPYRPYMLAASYCRYGSPVRKNTCLWTNLPLPEDLHKCCKDTPCRTKRMHGKHLQTAQAGPAGDTPGSGPAPATCTRYQTDCCGYYYHQQFCWYRIVWNVSNTHGDM